jgi:hypothetical protein
VEDRKPFSILKPEIKVNDIQKISYYLKITQNAPQLKAKNNSAK